MSKDSKEYSRAVPLLKAASYDLRRRLGVAFRQLGDSFLVRRSAQRHRVKSIRSLTRKAKDRGWTSQQALEKADDLVGYRVVCHNVQDIQRAADILEHSLKADKISVRRKDYIKHPKKSGYRAIHLLLRLPVQLGEQKMTVRCEVQLHSLLESAWAELSRAEIYTLEHVIDAALLRDMKRLSDQLYRADLIADRIRKRISRPRRGKRPVHGAPLNRSSIAFLFRQTFGSDPPDYLVEATLREYAHTPVRSDGLAIALADGDLLEKILGGYRQYASWEPDSAQVFLWIVHAAAYGTDSARRLAAKEGRTEWAEIDSFYRREVLSGLPKTWQELVDAITHPAKDEDITYDIRQWADALGALNSCFCGAKIVQSDSLAEALLDHYALENDEADEAHEAMERAVWSSGVETGDWGSSSICSYHGDVMRRDD